MTAPTKKVFIKTYGCQMNVYDSQRMNDALAAHGYTGAEAADDADLIVLNTCHIREKAAEKVYSEIGRLRTIKARRGGGVTIAVAGCVAQAEGEEIMRRAPAVDLVFGPQVYHRLPDMVEAARRGERVVATDFPAEDKFALLPAPDRRAIAARGSHAFVSVQEGCDKFCTFCVVPYTRGAEFSRSVAEIIDEVRRLADAGVMEITLLGQNVNAYHGADGRGRTASLADLLARLSEIGAISRLRYTTSHPRDMSDDLIAAHGALDKLMPYLHLPIQSGSDRVLTAMNRRHDTAFYMDIVARLKAVRPDLALSGDFIVGFPGERDEDFADTLRIVHAVGYAQAYSFKYSPRPGTPAAEMDTQLPEDVKNKRLALLQAAINAGQSAFNASCVGRQMDVLLDRPGRKTGQLAGRSPYLQAVHVNGPEDLMGTIQTVTITAAGPNSLGGLLDLPAAATPSSPAILQGAPS